MFRRSGFTIVELMIVVAIVGILGSMALPMFKHYKSKVRYAEATTQLGAIFHGQAAAWERVKQAHAISVANGTLPDTTRPGFVCFTPFQDGSFAFNMPIAEARMPRVNPGCAIDWSPSEPLCFSYITLKTAPYVNTNFAVEDLDGDESYGYLVEAIMERDGELYRAGRASGGDAGSGANIEGANFIAVLTGALGKLDGS